MSLETVEHTSQEIGSEDNESTMLNGCSDNNAENLEDSQGDGSKKMKEDAEEGELEEGELDDETEEFCGHSDQVSSEQSPNGAPVVQVPESESLLAKSEKRRERSDSERKSKGHSHHRSVPRTAPFDGIADVNKEDEGKEAHVRSQRHGKRREKQRSKEDSEKKKTNYSTYIDFDDIQDDFETEDSWMHGSRSKRSRRSRDSMRGPYDSPSGSGDEDFDVEDEMQSSSVNYRSQYQYAGGNYSGFYDTLPEEDEEDDDNELLDQRSDYSESKTHFMKQPSQDGGFKGSPSHYNHSKSSERKIRSQLPRKRKLVDTPMEERPACKFFREGKCVKGADCPFNHDFVPPKKEDVCRFYLNERGCTRENCVYYHADWPCRYYHKTGSCIYGDSCKFSHAELTEETKHLIYLDSSDDHHSENWRPSSTNDLLQSSEKKKIPSLLDLEIYPPGQEPKISSPTFSPRVPYKRQRSSGPMGGQPGLLGAGPQMSGGSGSRMSFRMRQMGCNSKGYYSSHGGDHYNNMDDSGSPQLMHSPDNSIQGEAGDEEPYQSRSGDEEDQEPMTSVTGGMGMATTGQSVEVSCLPPVQRDLYRRIQEHQQFPQTTLSQPSNNVQAEEKWYSSDEEGVGCDNRGSETTLSTTVTPADIIQSLAGQTSQTQKPLLPDSLQSMPPMFGMPPPRGLMPRGMPPTREMLQPPDMMMSQGQRSVQGMPHRPEMMPPQRTMAPDMKPKGISLMFPQTMAPPPDMMPPRSMMPPSDMMGQGMMLPRGMMSQGMMPPRGMMPPTDMMGQCMMPPRMMMPPNDIMGQGMMPPRGVPPPSDMMPLGMMPQRSMAPPSDMMSQGMRPPQGVNAPSDMRAMMPPGLSQPDGMPPLFNLSTQGIGQIDINHILSVIRNSTLQLPPNLLLSPTTTSDIMVNASSSSNFNQSQIPRTSGNMTDPRLQLTEPSPDVGMMPVSSFLQPPESPDQEIEINAAGKTVPYVLHPIIVESRPGPPSSINLENLQNSSDPRLQKYLNLSQANTKTRSGNEMDSSDNSVVPVKPTDPRLLKRGGSEARKPGDIESGNDGNKVTKQQKPYTLPDIVLPVLPNPVQEKTNAAKITDLTVSTSKAVLDDPAPRATSIPSPSIKPVDKTPQNLVELPEALQERNFPMDGRFSRQSSTGSLGPITTNADKKVIDYRNDPRYKKKKTKPLLEDSAVAQPQISGKVKEVLCPTAASTKEEWASSHNTKTEQSEPKVSDSSVSESPFRGNFKVQRQEVAEAEQEVEGNVGESESFNLESQKSEAVSVHTPVTFFEGVPVSSILSDVEPTQEINLKDMFKTIDPTTSPFC